MRFTFKKFEFDKKKIIAGAVILALSLYLDFNFVLIGRFKRLKVISPKIAELKRDITKLNKDMALVEVKERAAGKAQGTAEKTMEKIISEEKITQILEYISRVANERKVKIMRIVPLRSPGKPVKGASDTKYSSLLITLEISSGYHQLGRFINDLENADVFLEVDELQIRSDAKYYPEQQVSLALKTYVKE